MRSATTEFTHVPPYSTTQADSKQTSTVNNKSQQLMGQVLELTHSDNGRLIASKLYYYIHCLQLYCNGYANLPKIDETTTNASILSDMKYLEILQNELQAIVLSAAQQGLDNPDKVLDINTRLIEFEEKKIHPYLKKKQDDLVHLDNINKLNWLTNITYVSTIVTSYMTKGLQSFLHSLPILNRLSLLFPLLVIALNTIKNIFDLAYPITSRYYLNQIGEELDKPLTSASLYNKGYLMRVLGNATALALNVYMLSIFTKTLFTTPFGWALSAAIVAAEWASNSLVPAWQSWKNYCTLKHLNQKASNLDSSNLDKLLRNEIESCPEVQIAKENYLAKRNDAIWSSFSIAGSVLFACGFLCQPLFIAAVVCLLAAPTRNTMRFLVDQCAKRRHQRETAEGVAEPLLQKNTAQIQAKIQKQLITNPSKASFNDLSGNHSENSSPIKERMQRHDLIKRHSLPPPVYPKPCPSSSPSPFSYSLTP